MRRRGVGNKFGNSVGIKSSNQSGGGVWYWKDWTVSSGAPGEKEFASNTLRNSTECNPNQVTNDGYWLRCYVNPTTPAPAAWCSNSYNLRAEVATNPWEVNQPPGTEEWVGFKYRFGDNYVADDVENWVMFQNIVGGEPNDGPLISFLVSQGNPSQNLSVGEIAVVNASQVTPTNLFYDTDVIPVAGDILDVVVHVIWGDDATGLLQVWIDDVQVHNLQARTIRADALYGGNFKCGIYKSGWRNLAGVNASATQGITDMEMFIRDFRIRTRYTGDADYGVDAYSQVRPN